MPNYSVIINNDIGVTTWYKMGTTIRHREDGPAVETRSGYKVWWVNGKLHRLDGPAIEHDNGNKEWWVNNKQYTEEEFKKLIATKSEEEVITLNGKKYKLIE